MQSVNPDYFPSLIGVGLLTDILPDLPLPTCQPTPLEAMVIGHASGAGELKSETKRLLDSTDPQLCSQITKALTSIDTSFLKLKVTPPKNKSYRTDATSPALIKTLLRASGLSPQPKLQLRRLDLSGLTPTKSQESSPRVPGDVTTLPSLSIEDSLYPSPRAQHQKKTALQSVPIPSRNSGATPTVLTTPTSRSKRPRTSTTSSSSEQQQQQQGKRREKRKQSLVVSINRDNIGRATSGDRRQKQAGNKRRRLSSSTRSSEGDSPSLTVRIPRRKLHHSSTPASLPLQYPDMGGASLPGPGFVLAPNVRDEPQEQQLLGGKEKKKKKKKKIQDPAHVAQIKHYSHAISSILKQGDDMSSADDLYSRHVVSQILSETVRMKQFGVLHEVKSDLLVKLISTMDRHVLDTASLLLSSSPEDLDPKEWRGVARDRILRSLDASLVILHITTAPRVPTQVQLEESIDQLISHTRYHLENNIYPEFDPVYRSDGKDTGTLARQKRRYTNSSTVTNNKVLMAVYHRMVEVIDTLAELLKMQSLTDMTVLKLSSLGIFPFFVENVSNLQLSALKLVRTIFSRYEKHRELILEDIFASLGRLPTTKRNLRSFKLSNGQSIQMITALILQLVQCMVVPPAAANDSGSTHTNATPTSATPTHSPTTNQESKKPKVAVPVDVSMISSYDLALRTGSNFLSTFMKKCCSGKVEDDFRPLFDNFVQDLLITLSLPEWPASEVLLALLGIQLVQTFSNRSNDQQLRLTSLDHLGVIASRLRRDAVMSTKEDHDQLIDILSEIMQKKLDGISPLPSPTGVNRLDAFSENARHLRKALIAFLTQRTEADSSSAYARDFYIGQWLRDNQMELEKTLQSAAAGGGPSSPGHLSLALPDFAGGVATEFEGAELDGTDVTGKAVHQAERTKDFLISLLKPLSPSVVGSLSSILDDKSATVVTRYLTSDGVFSKSFDMYLHKLLRVLNEPAVHVRTRAMKALSTIVAADPNILSKAELQRAVQNRFSDSSTLMREAAVDLVGRFVLIQPALTTQYYDMLMERILDTGVSVRKRVIKILKDICTNQPDFEKITEICAKILRRINDEEGIRQLVTSIFHQMWFTVPTADQREALKRRVSHITEVITKTASEQDSFELLLRELIKNTDMKSSVLAVSQMIVDTLMERLLILDEASENRTSHSFVNCIATLHVFSKIQPSFLVNHARTLLPYLSSQCNTQEDILSVHYVANILEVVVPLLVRPSESFLSSLEEELIKLIMIQGPVIVQSCVSCLSVVVNKVSKNYTLVNECYSKFYNYLEKVRLIHRHDPKSPKLVSVKPSVLRSLFTVGLFCKHFDMNTVVIATTNDDDIKGEKMSVKVYSLLVFFCNVEDEEIQIKALVGLGFHCVRYPEMMLNKEAKDLYFHYLENDAPLKMKCQVIKNIQTHLMELESTLKEADANRLNKADAESNLMELGDRQSSVSSNIAQMYLGSLLQSHYATDVQVRLLTIQTILLILRQGLVHPGQCVPFLIAVSTDSEEQVRSNAEQQLTEYSNRFGGFMQTHLTHGLKKAHQFQLLISSSVAPRGYTDQTGSSVLSHLYTLVRSSKPQRRAFLQTVLRPFEEYETTSLGMLLFLADSLGTFPYLVFEEPLFVLHNIDLTISVTGASVLQSFREAFGQAGIAAADDEEEAEEDDIERLSQHSYNLVQLNECCHSSLGCVLLLLLKQHLKRSFNLSDKKCQEYTPTDNNKVWEKAVSRKQGVIYDPVTVISEVERETLGKRSQHTKDECLNLYIHFKRLMNRLDPFEADEDDPEQDSTAVKDNLLAAPPPVLSSTHHSLQRDKTPVAAAVPKSPSTKQRSRSRASSTSSGASGSGGISSRKRGRKSDVSKSAKKKKRRIVLSDDSEED